MFYLAIIDYFASLKNLSPEQQTTNSIVYECKDNDFFDKYKNIHVFFCILMQESSFLHSLYVFFGYFLLQIDGF